MVTLREFHVIEQVGVKLRALAAAHALLRVGVPLLGQFFGEVFHRVAKLPGVGRLAGEFSEALLHLVL